MSKCLLKKLKISRINSPRASLDLSENDENEDYDSTEEQNSRLRGDSFPLHFKSNQGQHAVVPPASIQSQISKDNKGAKFSKLDVLVDTCIGVEANRIATFESLERLADEIDFTVPSDYVGSTDDFDKQRSGAIFSPPKHSIERKNYSKPLLMNGGFPNATQEITAPEPKLATEDSSETIKHESQLMKVNVGGMDMSVRVVQIGNSCYLEPVTDSSSHALSNYASQILGMSSTSTQIPIIPGPQVTNAHNPQMIFSRSQNAAANANDISVDRLSKLMRVHSISPNTNSTAFDLLTKNDTSDSTLASLAAGSSSMNGNQFEPAQGYQTTQLPMLPPSFPTQPTSYSMQPTSYSMQPTSYSMQPALFPFAGNFQQQFSYDPRTSAYPGTYHEGMSQSMNPENISQFVHPYLAPSILPTTGSMLDNMHLLPPKHIYKTACDTFRVQVGKGVKGNPNGKFSRNIRDEADALWLCEIALLFIDCPPNLSEMLCNGNYKCLLQRNMVLNPSHYLASLTTKIEQMLSRGFLKQAEWERAIASLQTIQGTTPVAATVSSFTPNNILASASICTVPSSSSMSSLISSRKKRRRHNLGEKSGS